MWLRKDEKAKKVLERFTPHSVKPPHGSLSTNLALTWSKCSSKTTQMSISGGKMPKPYAKNQEPFLFMIPKCPGFGANLRT